MELILRDEDGNEVNMGVDPEELEETCETGAHTLYHALMETMSTLRGIQNHKNKSTEEKLKEKRKLEQLRGEPRPKQLHEQDPGVNSPRDYQ